MTARCVRQPAFLLVELLIVIVLGAAVMAILGQLLLDGLYVQRLAAQHEARVSIMDTLTRRLRHDARAATGYQWQAADQRGMLIISRRDGGSESTVHYVFEPARVRRSDASGESGGWEVDRLRFATRIEPGPRADVLQLDFIELPPPRGTHLSQRRFTASVLLPRAAAGHELEADERP
jgi:type II secretory pathway pseudopilin PulG